MYLFQVFLQGYSILIFFFCKPQPLQAAGSITGRQQPSTTGEAGARQD